MLNFLEERANELGFLESQVLDRKLRLFMVACGRRRWAFLPEHTREFVNTMDRYLEGELTKKELRGYRDRYVEGERALMNYVDSDPNPWTDARAFWGDGTSTRSEANLLREIFGPLPYRPVKVDPSWLKWNNGMVVQLAQGMYDDRKFQDLPILADALEDAGCTDPDILGHCRGPGPHTRGCWPVDLVLGKG
jgi:hypothetical protein